MDFCECKASLGYTGRPCLKKTQTQSSNSSEPEWEVPASLSEPQKFCSAKASIPLDSAWRGLQNSSEKSSPGKGCGSLSLWGGLGFPPQHCTTKQEPLA